MILGPQGSSINEDVKICLQVPRGRLSSRRFGYQRQGNSPVPPEWPLHVLGCLSYADKPSLAFLPSAKGGEN